ncbi:MAG: nucleoside triphosphate pyrophosphohydrolase [Butyricicoccus pullicaecorum]
MVDFTFKEKYTYEDLLEIMRILRCPEGCVWDREQDHKSIRRSFIEETYEAVEAIDNDDPVLLQEELGDVLLQVVFHAQIEAEAGRFTMDDVADGICKKMIYRHPHVFGSVEVKNSDEVLTNWDALKQKEKHQKSTTETLESVARSLPGLIRAEKVQHKAAKVGFDWDEVSGALDKVREETAEVACAIDGDGDPSEELGDLLFAVVNVARFPRPIPRMPSTARRISLSVGRRVEQAAKDAAIACRDEPCRNGRALGRCQAEGAR